MRSVSCHQIFHHINSLRKSQDHFWSDDCCWSTHSENLKTTSGLMTAVDQRGHVHMPAWWPPSLSPFLLDPSFPPSLTPSLSFCLPPPVNLRSSFHITLKVSNKCALFCRTYWRHRYSDIPVSESSSKRRTQGLDLQRVSGLLLLTAISLLILLYCYFFPLDCHYKLSVYSLY